MLRKSSSSIPGRNMYGGFPGSAITPALLSPAEATGAVAVSSSAEPTAPEASLTSRYLLDDFSKVQQTVAAQVQPHPFGMANGGGRKRQAYYEARRQPDKLDFSSIRGKEERKGRAGEREKESFGRRPAVIFHALIVR